MRLGRKRGDGAGADPVGSDKSALAVAAALERDIRPAAHAVIGAFLGDSSSETARSESDGATFLLDGSVGGAVTGGGPLNGLPALTAGAVHQFTNPWLIPVNMGFTPTNHVGMAIKAVLMV